MWAYSDEAVRRSDRGGALDSEDYNAPDGILGPYREKEGSYYSVREVWSPIYVEPLMITPSFRGEFRVSNRFLFTNLDKCSMRWRVLHCASPLQGEAVGSPVSVADGGAQTWRQVVDSGMVQLPSLVPGETGFARITAPKLFEGDILELEAYGVDGESICTRTFPIHYAKDYLQGELQANAHSSASEASATGNCRVEETDTLITLHSPAVTVSFRKSDATITSVIRNADSRVVPLKDGPVAVGMKMILSNLSARTENGDAVLCARYRGAADSIVWRLTPAGLLSMDAVLLNRASGGGGFDDAFTDTEVLKPRTHFLISRIRVLGHALDGDVVRTVSGRTVSPVPTMASGRKIITIPLPVKAPTALCIPNSRAIMPTSIGLPCKVLRFLSPCMPPVMASSCGYSRRKNPTAARMASIPCPTSPREIFPSCSIFRVSVASSPSANMVHRASRELSASRKETKDYG